MDKAAILIELKKAEKDYQTILNIESKFWDSIIAYRLQYGLCYFFDNDLYIMHEIEKDLDKIVQRGYYWYPSAKIMSIEKTEFIKKHALKPRLEHLQRTINRIENELKNQPTI